MIGRGYHMVNTITLAELLELGASECSPIVGYQDLW